MHGDCIYIKYIFNSYSLTLIWKVSKFWINVQTLMVGICSTLYFKIPAATLISVLFARYHYENEESCWSWLAYNFQHHILKHCHSKCFKYVTRQQLRYPNGPQNDTNTKGSLWHMCCVHLFQTVVPLPHKALATKGKTLLLTMLLHKYVYEFHLSAPYSSVDFILNSFMLFFSHCC